MNPHTKLSHGFEVDVGRREDRMGYEKNSYSGGRLVFREELDEGVVIQLREEDRHRYDSGEPLIPSISDIQRA